MPPPPLPKSTISSSKKTWNETDFRAHRCLFLLGSFILRVDFVGYQLGVVIFIPCK